MIALSILVPSVHTRRATFGPIIQDQLFGQWEALTEHDQRRVEILMLTDTKSMMLGDKRNVMMEIAQGEYLQFVDDDDRVEPDMIKTILQAIDDHHPDVVTFLSSVVINGGEPQICHFSTRWRKDSNTETGYRRIPNHLCATRRDLARKVSYPSVIRGEDGGYSKLLLPHLKTEHHIDRVLYHYDFSSETTETQRPLPVPARVRPDAEPIVDVIVLSNAKTHGLRRMTQQTINTCRSGANGLPVRVFVLEGRRGIKYQGAKVLPSVEPFHYNKAANLGARAGDAPWIMIANNDLQFENGWLHELLAAGWPIVSPHNPGDPRQANLEANETGDVTGRHLSGWCFMIKRDMWEDIGGFDEQVRFWCSDDVVVQQCLKLGTHPMVVPTARVRHLGSATLKSETGAQELTWGQVKIYNDMFGKSKFVDHPRYQAYLRRTAR